MAKAVCNVPLSALLEQLTPKIEAYVRDQLLTFAAVEQARALEWAAGRIDPGPAGQRTAESEGDSWVQCADRGTAVKMRGWADAIRSGLLAIPADQEEVR